MQPGGSDSASPGAAMTLCDGRSVYTVDAHRDEDTACSATILGCGRRSRRARMFAFPRSGAHGLVRTNQPGGVTCSLSVSTRRRETCRRAANWLHTYNHHRGHSALGGHPPPSRVPNPSGQNT